MKVAVIGTGSMGRNHARVYSEMPGVELAAVADSNYELAQDLGRQYGVQAYADHRELLEKEKPEGVTVAVPTALHEIVGTDALDAGAHVLMEKPIAATLNEGRRLIDKAKAAGRQLMVGHIVRFNPAVLALRRKLQEGAAGRIFQIFCRRAGPFPARVRDVGVVIDLAPHDVDIMRYLTGWDVVRVYAETEQRIHTEHEDLLWGTLRFADGTIGALEINWLTPTKIRETYVLGERGLFRVDDLTQDLYFFENPQARELPWNALATLKGVSEGNVTRFEIPRREPLKVELEAFAEAIRTGSPMPVGGDDGLAALELSLALVESGQTHRVVEL